MDNITFNVGTLFHCDRLYEYEEAQTFDPFWTQTVKGCRIVKLLQEMYRFNLSYVMQKMDSNGTLLKDTMALYPELNDNIDIYTRPMSLRPHLLQFGYPVQAIYNWKFGFILRRPEDNRLFQTFYSRPFTRPLWNCLYGMAIIISIIFYLLQVWEKQVVGRVQENGVTYEILMVMGSYCQHIPPIHAALSSRRTAYFVFLIFAYVISSFYSSNLLSHLVNDKNKGMDLETLSKSDYDYAILDSIKILVDYNIAANKHLSMVNDKLFNFKPVSILNGLRRVKKGKTALLSDFRSLDPYMKITFDTEDLCKLIRIDLSSNMIKYFFISQNFPFKEQIKIGIQRAKEVGILKRLINIDHQLMVDCEPPKHFQTTIIQIFSPLTALICAYALSILILFAERYHFQRHRLFPYID